MCHFPLEHTKTAILYNLSTFTQRNFFICTKVYNRASVNEGPKSVWISESIAY